MKTERTYEFKFSESISPIQHLAFLCKMLEAAEFGEKDFTVNDEITEFAEENAA